MAVDERSEVRFLSPKGRCRGNQFCGPNLGPIHRIGFACDSVDGGVRQEVQVLRWTHWPTNNNLQAAVDSRAGYSQAGRCI